MRARSAACVLAGLAALSAAPAIAEPPAPITTQLFSFPGAVWGPSSATSAGLALANRWLGDDPFGNPAATPRGGVVLSPAMLRMSRQDLRADNRRYDERPAFFDVSGAWLGHRYGGIGLAIYADQPVLRLEDNAFERGIRGGPVPPAVIQSTASAREMRAGLAVSLRRGAVGLGIAGEWMNRSDRYEVIEQSGAPDAGARTVDFSGGGPSGQAGVRIDFGGAEEPRVALGLGVRYVPEVTLDGEQTSELTLGGSGSAPVSVRREAGIEGGVSVRYAPTSALRVGVGVGGRTAQAWEGFGVESGRATLGSVAVEYHDPRDAWTARIGLGQEQQSEVPEPRAGVLGLGFGWNLESMRLEIGVVRRSVERTNHPTSFDDRVVVSVAFDL